MLRIITIAAIFATATTALTGKEEKAAPPADHNYKLSERLNGAGNLGSSAPNHKLDQLFHKVGLNGKRVMDLGCGLGGYTLHLAKQFNADIIGVDPNEQYIQLAKKNHKKAQNLKGTVAFQVMQNRLNLKEHKTDSFDVILAKQVFFEVKDKPGLIREVKRVLKPRGMLVIVDLIQGGGGMHPPAPKRTAPPVTHGSGARFHSIWGEQPDKAGYQRMLADAELEAIQDEDITEDFIQQLESDIRSANLEKPNLEVEFGAPQVNQSLHQMWDQHTWLQQHRLEAHILIGKKRA